MTQIHAGLRPDSRKAPVRPPTGPLGGRNDGFLVGRITHHGACPEFAEWDGVAYATERSARLALDQANHWRPGWRIYALTDITERPTE
jgi:hypothetical protein